VDLSRAYKLVTLYQKELRHLTNAVNVIDLATMLHLNNEVIPIYREFYTMGIHQIKNQFKFKNLHYSIPLTSWVETAEAFLQHCEHLYKTYDSMERNPAFQFINQVTIPTLANIEKSGIQTTDGLVYSDYNIYTSTGRPSNAFGGINFAALNKNDGSREKFISRFGENGTLVQFDYEAFHLRLAANMIGYQLPETSVHTFLAKQYYGTDDITDEMYEESKARTFALMYGQTDDTGGVEFFQNIKEYSSKLWEEYRQNGFVLSKTGRKVTMPDPSKNKVFNYMMQLIETEEAISRVENVCNFLGMMNSKVILYTYDAILLDVHNDELDSMDKVSELLSVGGYPVRQYRGHNYNELNLI
jgi:DNA polymerase I-like protein with 3'-5' exonuclease and polymerase domains